MHGKTRGNDFAIDDDVWTAGNERYLTCSATTYTSPSAKD
jgi:hypothetical protein